MTLTIDNLKSTIEFINEPIIIFTKDLSEIYSNNLAKNKFDDYQKTIIEIILKNNDESIELNLELQDDKILNLVINSKNVFINNIYYYICTILDVSAYKKTSEEIKGFKSHIITTISQKAKETNTLKKQHHDDINNYQQDINKLKVKILDDKKLIDNFKYRVKTLDKKNEELKEKIMKMIKNNFSFEDLLEFEIKRAKSLNTKFSLVLISINLYEEIFLSNEYRAKDEIIINATLRYFKNTIRNHDIVQYVDNGMFYFILSNRVDFNISKMIDDLTQPRVLLDKLKIDFTSGMSHFYKHDNVESIIYRCMKDHSEHVQNKLQDNR